jgi:ComF family protein
VVPKSSIPTPRDLPDSGARKILDGLLNLIYPEVCLLCSAQVSRRRDCGVCRSCWERALGLKIVPPRCSSCGMPFQNLETESEHLCGNCIQHPPPFAGARSFGLYAGEISALIQGFKFQNRRNLGGLLVPLLADTFFDSWRREDFDFIVPVPLHKRRKRERGYNQSELLARSLARQIAVPFIDSLLRVRATAPQVGLTDSQRLENMHNAFRCSLPAQTSKQRVLLIDDVMTTGATVASAARALLDAGAWRVSVLTIARAARW